MRFHPRHQASNFSNFCSSILRLSAWSPAVAESHVFVADIHKLTGIVPPLSALYALDMPYPSSGRLTSDTA